MSRSWIWAEADRTAQAKIAQSSTFIAHSYPRKESTSLLTWPNRECRKHKLFQLIPFFRAYPHLLRYLAWLRQQP